ncbi:unnamed protein product [Moritella viscosa]|uniref:Uncharacterized protein n=1 Tax=Moritella viscosa TaxID=80854 RepID=A0A1K9ZU39_9GAMM|nr:unnamed protein product [Moritella viscosa]SGY95279.1 unnamed protein product [Moritella viscosa]SGY95665.1 unnamed protein product [Moritella viscosa]SGZ00240.1 unnamed protein product [Moritella viscosa]SHO06211.1 unnamed protein product [Moritella viscosa]
MQSTPNYVLYRRGSCLGARRISMSASISGVRKTLLQMMDVPL